MKISFKREFAECYARGNLTSQKYAELKEEFQQLFNKIVRRLSYETTSDN